MPLAERKLAAALLLIAACGPPLTPPTAEPSSDTDRKAPAPIITTERGPRGGHLVFVDENGARVAELSRSTPTMSRDNSPSVSPDGRFVVFASSRQRASFAQTSLWIMGAYPGAEPVRLTDHAATDRDPVWLADDTLVFASSRAGSFDLFRAELARKDDRWVLAGVPVRLTRAPTHEISPVVSPDKQTIAYAAVDDETRSLTLWSIPAAGGTPQKLTEGPADMTPAYFPDGKRLAFAAPAPGRRDTDIFVINTDGSGRRVLVSEPYGDETGPVIAPGGRFVFATSVYRSVKTNKPVLASIVVADLSASPPVFRALHDPVAVESRIGVALLPAALDAKALEKNRVYLEALQHAVKEQLRREFDARQ